MKKNNDCCPCRNGCGVVGTILGIIIGIIIAIFFSLGFTPLILTGVWIAFALGAAVLTYVIITGLINSSNDIRSDSGSCFCRYAKCLLFGSVGTVLSALAALSITLDIAVTAIVVLIGIGVFFFVFMISALISYIKCLIRKSCS
ncbi:MAG: hypothetical protein IKE05_01690 [Clostridia bacterium]|nr:hypothetical protein [Clostridia bacterium]